MACPALTPAPLKISIGLRLFASVLLSILVVAAGGIALMRHNVLNSFSEYAANIELDRLEQLSQDLAARHQAQGGWGFVPRDPAGQRGFLRSELARLAQRRATPAPPAPPAAPAAPRLPAVPDAVTAPLPPLPPPVALPAPPAPPAPPAVEPDVNQLGLPERITLFDAEGRYLAGRRPGGEQSARRAIEADDRVIGHLAVARVLAPSDALAAAFLGQLASSLWGIVAASVALSALAAMLLAAHFRKPIRTLSRGAHALAEGRFDTRLDAVRSDELGDLAHSFNQLAERLEAMEQSRRQWVADTSHELRTPLAVLRAQLEAIQDGVRQPDADTVAAMLRQVLALNKLIDQLYALARADVGALDLARQPLDLWALARETAAAFGERVLAAGLALELGQAPRHAQVLADPDRMRQVFANLMENAVRYTAAGGRVALHAQLRAGELAIVVEDSAPGVPDHALARLAERFYRVDASRSREQGGAGLGLALVQRIVEAHGARIAYTHSPLGGLRATIIFPLADT